LHRRKFTIKKVTLQVAKPSSKGLTAERLFKTELKIP
jgi:hypothetical protein